MNLGRAIGNVIFLGLFGLVFLGVGLAVMWWMGALTTLTCPAAEAPGVRPAGACTLTQTNVFGRVSRTVTMPATELLGARLEVSSDDDDGDTYRVVLRTERGEVPFTDYYSSDRAPKDKVLAAVNAYVADPAGPRLEAGQDERLFALIFGGVFALVGLGISLGGVWAAVARLVGG
jgi:hypothetical protein